MLGIIASIIDGVLVGLVYGLAAMGLTLIWGVMDVINLTHGAMIVAGMFAVYLLVQALGISPYAALPPVLVVGFGVGVLLYWIAVHRMIGRPPLIIFPPLGGPAQALWVIYFLMVAVMGLSLYLSYAIKTSKFGLGLLAIGQNENVAAILGVPTPLYKALVYSASAFLPAIAGGLYFLKSSFIQPSDAFDLTLSTEAIVIAMLGGQGTVTGVALGAYLYEVLRGYLLTSETFSHFQLVVAGVLLLLIVLFFPGGLMGFIYRQFPRTQKVLE